MADLRGRPLSLPYRSSDGIIEPDASGLLRGEFPYKVGLQEMRLFVGWEDARGHQMRYTGLRF